MGTSATRSCGYMPAYPGYLPCTREQGHEGPCAHDLAAQPSELECRCHALLLQEAALGIRALRRIAWVAIALIVLLFLAGCISVNKQVYILALPGATVSSEQNSSTDASGNTASASGELSAPLLGG